MSKKLLRPSTVRKRIHAIREQIDQAEREFNAFRFEAGGKILELKRRCPHERTHTAMGTPYDRPEVTCEDCGARGLALGDNHNYRNNNEQSECN